MQILDKRTALAIWPVLRLGFRPFFLLGALLALLAIPLWLLALNGSTLLPSPAGGWLASPHWLSQLSKPEVGGGC